MQLYLAAEQALAAAEQDLNALMRYESAASEKMIFLSANSDGDRSTWTDNLTAACNGEWSKQYNTKIQDLSYPLPV
jgi:hypothetical protein